VLPVEIVPLQDTVVLRARGSELLILPHHVVELKTKKTPRDFTTYFTGEALINRPARKLFEAWLRKDNTLWPRLYKTIHEQMQADGTTTAEKTADKPTEKAAHAKPAKAEVSKADKTVKAEKASVKAEAKKEEKSAKKEAPAKKEEKPAKVAKAPKAEDKKTAKKEVAAKNTDKKPAKKDAPAKKPAAGAKTKKPAKKK
jgi:hypothetical protein